VSFKQTKGKLPRKEDKARWACLSDILRRTSGGGIGPAEGANGERSESTRSNIRSFMTAGIMLGKNPRGGRKVELDGFSESMSDIW